MKYLSILFFLIGSILFAQAPVKVPILIYHAIRPEKISDSPFVLKYVCTPKLFEKEMSYLHNNGYTSISFEDLTNYFNNKKVLPKKPVIISFDDSWRDQYIYALPILKRYHFKATFFIITGSVGHRYFLTWRDIRMLATFGMEIGSHSVTHPFLTKVGWRNLKWEIVDSKKIIEAELENKVTTFAYPYGAYNPIVIQIVKWAGYTSARGVAIKEDTNRNKKDLFALKDNIYTNTMNGFLESFVDK